MAASPGLQPTAVGLLPKGRAHFALSRSLLWSGSLDTTSRAQNLRLKKNSRELRLFWQFNTVNTYKELGLFVLMREGSWKPNSDTVYEDNFSLCFRSLDVSLSFLYLTRPVHGQWIPGGSHTPTVAHWLLTLLKVLNWKCLDRKRRLDENSSGREKVWVSEVTELAKEDWGAMLLFLPCLISLSTFLQDLYFLKTLIFIKD